MTEQLRSAVAFGLAIDRLTQADRAMIALACHLLDLERETVAAALVRLARQTPDHPGKTGHFSDDKLVRALNQLSGDERRYWVRVFTELMSDRDGIRLGQLFDLLDTRLAT